MMLDLPSLNCLSSTWKLAWNKNSTRPSANINVRQLSKPTKLFCSIIVSCKTSLTSKEGWLLNATNLPSLWNWPKAALLSWRKQLPTTSVRMHLATPWGRSCRTTAVSPATLTYLKSFTMLLTSQRPRTAKRTGSSISTLHFGGQLYGSGSCGSFTSVCCS